MVSDSWFRGLWKTSKKHEASTEKVKIGVLAFEVAGLMSKLVHLWKSLSDKQVARLREEIINSAGIRNLISQDDEYIVKLICAEMIENLGNVAAAVARLAKKCRDPFLKSFEQALNDLLKMGADPYRWKLTWKKMDSKAKKMERFILINSNLYQELEALADFEQSLRRMKCNDDTYTISLVEYEKKVAWKQQEVKHLKEISLWNKTYDYTIYLLARSIFTIFCRIEHVFGVNPVLDRGVADSREQDSDYARRSHSVVFMQSSVHPSENSDSLFLSGPLRSMTAKSGPMSRKKDRNNFYSGPLESSVATSRPISGRHHNSSLYAGPLGSSTTHSGLLGKAKKSSLSFWKSLHQSSNLQGRFLNSRFNGLTTAGPSKGSMMGDDSSYGRSDANGDTHPCTNLIRGNLSFFSSKKRLLNAPPETLGAAALALHYANVIIVIEKLVASPQLIGQDARDDLYNMLPGSIRTSLRVKLKPFARSLSSLTYDTDLAGEWNEAISGILDWLAPLAHNTVRWQSERSFEHQNLVSRTNVLLVHTLYFANQEKTETIITELLIGLNYVWQFGRELNANEAVESVSARTSDGYLED